MAVKNYNCMWFSFVTGIIFLLDSNDLEHVMLLYIVYS